MSVRRYRLANQPFRRRIPEVFGHTSDDIISTFHEASWLAGPVGLLRARAAQRGLAIIFDVPRAGAIIKHHLTSPNDVRSLWRFQTEYVVFASLALTTTYGIMSAVSGAATIPSAAHAISLSTSLAMMAACRRASTRAFGAPNMPISR